MSRLRAIALRLTMVNPIFIALFIGIVPIDPTFSPIQDAAAAINFPYPGWVIIAILSVLY